MDIKNARYTITITDHDAYNIANTTYLYLKNSIETHYTKLQQNKDGEDVFLKQEAEGINRMKFFYMICGRYDMYDWYFNEFIKMFKENRECNHDPQSTK